MNFEQEALDALKSLQAEYLNSVWKTFAALMVSIGWVMSSQETRHFLEATLAVKGVAIAVVLGLALMHWLTLHDLQTKSQRIFDQILHRDELFGAVKTSYEIKRIYIYASFLINGLLYVLLLTIILNADSTLST
ncbi:hypothetical protein DV711_19165 [Motiliproteus coralliicola]|uniref:Uncharacterized protein n=1 Tax=Motiliproteus coralliicola TaxID=2283196 RepID=A0A369W7W2_9GAMM|nr:hypothetical protein [Motiliproteus coralliicola]RDE18002.1 hypothetical protein DV711_19165 [Motiliproteus coralliicola]